jgi:4-oxalocrotonate tautomerase
MPYMHIHLSPGQLDVASKNRLAAGATRLLADILHKKPEVTVVQIEAASSEPWFTAGTPLLQHGRTAFSEVKITEGTNTKEEKSRFLAEFHRLLEDTVGRLSAPAYTVIHEVPRSDWGYDGLSQAERGGRP